MEQNKKITNAQLKRRIANAVLHIDKTKDTQSIYFSDKGLRLTVDNDYAIVETGYHRHVFDALNPYVDDGIFNPLDGKYIKPPYSRPWIYTKRVIEIANDNDCKTDNGYSFEKLLEVLKAKDDKTEYNIVTYVDWWIFNCSQPLYSIGEGDIRLFLVYEDYLHNIARNVILLSEKTDDMTNKQFFDAVIKNMQEFIDGIDELVIFHKKTDEEVARENIDALQEQVLNEMMEKQNNGR